MSEIFNRLVEEEVAKCVILVNVVWKQGAKEEHESGSSSVLAVTSFGASNISGDSLARAGKACPHHVMRFASAKEASLFLEVHGNHLRFVYV